jgi:ribosomal protein L40E
MPIGRAKNLHWKLPNGLTDFENSFKESTVTCDKPICEKCATEVSKGAHICKDCGKKIKAEG